MEPSTKQKIVTQLLPQPFGRNGKVWVTVLSVLCVAGVLAYLHQLSKGLVITSMRDYAAWGIYISNFVFFVAISLVGSLITAVFRLLNVQWSKPLTRIA